MPKFGGYDFALVVTLWVDQVYQGVPMYQAHYRRGGLSRYSWRSGSVSMGRPRRSTPMRTYEYAQILAGYKRVLRSLNVPGVYGDSLLSHEQPPM